ncbi:MAG: class I SAM-dependent methyltransferase [Bacteroidota bacterium]
MNERVFNQTAEKLRSHERQERLEVDRVADLVAEDIPAGNSLLDIGTGSALFAEAFHKRGLKVSGIDLNPEMIALSSKLLPECDFRLGLAEDLPFEDNSFHTAFMGLVFHEVDDHLKTLREASRVAVSKVAILEWKFVSEEAGPPIEHRMDPAIIRQLSEEAGFAQFRTVGLRKMDLYILTK